MKIWDAFMAAAVALGLFIAATQFAGAADRLTVDLPDVSGLSRDDAEALAKQVAEVDVITSNCAGYEISDGEWTLLAGTGDKLAAKLGLDPTAYEQIVYAPAFALLDDAGACDRVGPQAAPLIERLVSMGGGTEPNSGASSAATAAPAANEGGEEKPAE